MTRRLNKSVVSGGVVYPAGTAATDELESRITNPTVWDDDSIFDIVTEAPADAGPGYGSWDKAKLQDEIDGRNATRETPIEVAGKGNKADLIAALVADDQTD